MYINSQCCCQLQNVLIYGTHCKNVCSRRGSYSDLNGKHSIVLNHNGHVTQLPTWVHSIFHRSQEFILYKPPKNKLCIKLLKKSQTNVRAYNLGFMFITPRFVCCMGEDVSSCQLESGKFVKLCREQIQ